MSQSPSLEEQLAMAQQTLALERDAHSAVKAQLDRLTTLSTNPDPHKSHPLYCSFCGKIHTEVRELIAGPAVLICDECVDLCSEILHKKAEADPVPSPQQTIHLTIEQLSQMDQRQFDGLLIEALLLRRRS